MDFSRGGIPARLLKVRIYFSPCIIVSVAVTNLRKTIKTSLMFVQLGAKVNSSYYCDVVLNQDLLTDMQKLSGDKFTFSTGWCTSSSFMTDSCIFASLCARICRTRKLAAEQPRLKFSGQFDLWDHSNSLFTVVIEFEMLSTWKSPANLLGADWSRRYQLRYRTVSQTTVARCCNRWRTHWAPLWLLFLVLHVHYHTYVFRRRNTKLG